MSLADCTLKPELTRHCVAVRLESRERKVWSAAMAATLVKMLVIAIPKCLSEMGIVMMPSGELPGGDYGS